jgi:hypothetical protein
MEGDAATGASRGPGARAGPCSGPAICCGQVMCCQSKDGDAVCRTFCVGGQCTAIPENATATPHQQQSCGEQKQRASGASQEQHCVLQVGTRAAGPYGAPVFSGTYVGWPIIAIQDGQDRQPPPPAQDSHEAAISSTSSSRPQVPRLDLTGNSQLDSGATWNSHETQSRSRTGAQTVIVGTPRRSSRVSVAQLLLQSGGTPKGLQGTSQGPSAGPEVGRQRVDGSEQQLRQQVQQQLYLLLTEMLLLAGSVSLAPRRTLSAVLSAALDRTLSGGLPAATTAAGMMPPHHLVCRSFNSPTVTLSIAASACVFWHHKGPVMGLANIRRSR